MVCCLRRVKATGSKFACDYSGHDREGGGNKNAIELGPQL